MNHELFVVLSGFESPFFQLSDINGKIGKNISRCDENSDKSESSSSSNLHKAMCDTFSSHFHPCEVNIIQEILSIAQLYKKILVFRGRIISDYTFEEVPSLNCSSNGENKPGQYLTSLGTAMYEETESYRKKIVQLEQDCLENPRLLLSSLLLDIRPYQYIFEMLCSIIDEVELKKLHGCAILDYLYKASIFAVGEAQDALTRIRAALQKVLSEQLNYWILYGELLDPYQEFFIKCFSKGIEIQSCNKLAENVEVSLEVEMLPDFIPLSAAQNILFIGESILHFDHEKSEGLYLRRGPSRKAKELSSAHFDSTLCSRLSFSSDSNLLDLVEKERKYVAKQLYCLVSTYGMIDMFDNMKNIYLLGRGELFHAFFSIIENTPVNAFNINGLFHKAGRQVALPASIMEKVKVSLLEPNLPVIQSKISKNIHIDFKIEWPLHKVFNSVALQKYNNVMRFLLSIQHTQHRLRNLWLQQMQKKEKQLSQFRMLCLTVQHHMSLLIYNIQYYLQVDVLESQLNELLNAINATEDYQVLCFHHDSFLASVTAQCFLSHPLVSNIISLTLDTINEFCSLLLSSTWSVDSEQRVKSLQGEFNAASAKFFWALNSLCQAKNGRFTSQLIMRIDYNKFYSQRSDLNRMYFDS